MYISTSSSSFRKLLCFVCQAVFLKWDYFQSKLIFNKCILNVICSAGWCRLVSKIVFPPRILKSHVWRGCKFTRRRKQMGRVRKVPQEKEVQRKDCRCSLRGGRTHIQWGRLGGLHRGDDIWAGSWRMARISMGMGGGRGPGRKRAQDEQLHISGKAWDV